MLLLPAGILAVPAGARGESPRLFLLGDATEAGWNEWLPEEMVNIGNGCFLWDGYLEAGNFKFLDSRGDWGAGIAPDGDSVEIRMMEQMGISRQPYGTNSFRNPEAGWLRMVVNMRDMSVNFRRPALGLTGPAALGWGLGSTVIPIFADDEGNVEWTGQLRVGELKILADGCRDWVPCYNAPFEGDVLSAGGHAVVYNTSDYKDGVFVDFKYNVPRAGTYTLKFKGELSGGGFYGVDVATGAEPSLDGAFAAAPGRYLVALDRRARRVHVAAVPQRLYIGTSGSECVELAGASGESFSAVAYLRQGEYYKLSTDPADWDNCALSPDTDTDLTAGATANLAPMHGFSYIVPADGYYDVSVDFSGAASVISARRHELSAVADAEGAAVSVGVRGGVLAVEGEYRALAVYDVAGRMVASSAPCRVSRGVYVVKVDNNIFKISVK